MIDAQIAATVVGGDGNDLIFASGTDLIVAGPGNETVIGGFTAGVSSGTDPIDHEPTSYAPGATWSASLSDGQLSYTGVNPVGVSGSTPPSGYEGNVDGNDEIASSNDTTIFGGSGHDLILLSNGDNDVELGTGSSTVFGGMGSDTIIGGGGNNSLVGGGGDDYIATGDGNTFATGHGGDNTIIGGAGNDTLIAGNSGTAWASAETGSDYVQAGSGNTLIYGSGGDDTLIGGAGNDTINAGSGNESVVGGSGNELIYGGSGSDTIDAGGDGADTIQAGSGATTIYGGDGSDFLYGGSGTNVIYVGDGGTDSASTYAFAGSGDTTIYGGDGEDYLAGGAGNDVIYAGDGGDAAVASTVVVGTGNTTVHGGDGVDVIEGGSGTDVLYAGDGGIEGSATAVTAGLGVTTLYGGAGVSVLTDSVGGSDQLIGGDGTTNMYGIGNDTFIAGTGSEFLSGTGSNSYVFKADGGNDEVANAGGTETLDFSYDSDPTDDVTLSAVTVNDGSVALEISDGDTDVLVDGGLTGANVAAVLFGNSQTESLANLVQAADAAGNAFDAVVAGANGNLTFDTGSGDSLEGGAGQDTISAWGTNDSLTAGAGGTAMYAQGADATLTGGSGSDTLAAYGANSVLDGGSGNETFEVNDSSEVVTALADASNALITSVSYTLPTNVDVATVAGSGNVTVSGNNDAADAITGNSGNDEIIAGRGNDTLVSGSGIDTLVGGQGADTFIINNSNDQLSFRGYAGNDTVYSSVSYSLKSGVAYLTLTGSGNLTATDDAGYVTLTGNAGNDTLVGGSGSDTLVAGTGADTFVTGSGNNTFIIDNTADVIDISSGAGADTVQSSVSYTLQQGLDTLQLIGSANLVGEGNGDVQNLIVGNAGSDTLIAGSGSDTLVAGTGVDTLISGSGQDLLEGNGGDTFVLSGSGNAEIQVSQGTGILQFGAGVTAADLSLSLVGGSDGAPALLISGDGVSITVDGGLQGSIGTFDFADGSQLTLAKLLSAGHVESSTLGGANGNFILDGTAGDSLEGGTGSDTLVGTGVGDTIEAGSGNQSLYGYGSGDVLVAGVGDDTIYGSGDDTLAAGSGNSTLYGGPGQNTYLLTQGGSATLYGSSAASGPQVILLPAGTTAADFSPHVSPDGDLILQSDSGDTLAVIRGFYSDADANTAWILADQSGDSQLLRDWVSTSSQGSTGGGTSGSSGYASEVQAALEEYQANLTITLNEMGIDGATIVDPTGHSLANQYNFTGVSTQNLTVQGGSLYVGGGSDSVQWQTITTYEGTETESYSVPEYSTYTTPGSFTFVPENDADLANLETDGITLTPVTVNGQTGFEYYNPPQKVTVQTGTQTVTTTVPVYSYYTTETQGFTEYNITGDGGSDVITAAAPFLGTVTTGDGNNVNVDLGIDDMDYWGNGAGAPLWLGHLTYAYPDPLDPGAFIDVGNGINDTIEGTGSADVIAAGLGFDYIFASLGSTVYVPMEGASTDVIATTNAPYYGSGPFPKNTLVLPEGVTPQNLQVRAIYDPALAFGDNGSGTSSATGSFLQLTYGDSTVLLEYGSPTSPYLQNASSDDTDGINIVQFSDGTVLTRSELLAMAGSSIVSVDDTYNPVVTQLAQNVQENTEVSAADLFTATDASGSSITLYQISNDTASGAYFSLNGTMYSPGQEFQVAADQLSQLQYIPGALGSTDTLNVVAFDGFVFGNETNISLPVVAPSSLYFRSRQRWQRSTRHERRSVRLRQAMTRRVSRRRPNCAARLPRNKRRRRHYARRERVWGSRRKCSR